MPELPEVETIVRGLRERIGGKTIKGIEVFTPGVIRGGTAPLKALVHGSISSIERRGKAILLEIGARCYLLIHLGMTGRLIFSEEEGLPQDRHTHLRFLFLPSGQLIYHDVRKFGHLELHKGVDIDQIPLVKDLGVDPLGPEFSQQGLAAMLMGSSRSIKEFLLEQRHIAGLGNIYSCECLFQAGISPWRKAHQLSEREVARLYQAIRQTLQEALRHRGTTFSDYLDAEGRTGDYQDLLRVYGREGEPCLRCSTPIKRGKMGGRSTYYCPSCQR